MVQPSTLKISAQTNVTIHIINLEEKNLLVGSDLVFVGCRRRRDPSQSFKIFASQDAEHFCQPTQQHHHQQYYERQSRRPPQLASKTLTP